MRKTAGNSQNYVYECVVLIPRSTNHKCQKLNLWPGGNYVAFFVPSQVQNGVRGYHYDQTLPRPPIVQTSINYKNIYMRSDKCVSVCDI